MPLFLICTFTSKMDNSILNYLTNKIALASTLKGCNFTSPMFLVKCFKGALERRFPEFLEQTVKLKIFLIDFCFFIFYFNFPIICVGDYVLLYMWWMCVWLYVNVCITCFCACILFYLLWRVSYEMQGILTQWPAPDPMG